MLADAVHGGAAEQVDIDGSRIDISLQVSQKIRIWWKSSFFLVTYYIYISYILDSLHVKYSYCSRAVSKWVQNSVSKHLSLTDSLGL